MQHATGQVHGNSAGPAQGMCNNKVAKTTATKAIYKSNMPRTMCEKRAHGQTKACAKPRVQRRRSPKDEQQHVPTPATTEPARELAWHRGKTLAAQGRPPPQARSTNNARDEDNVDDQVRASWHTTNTRPRAKEEDHEDQPILEHEHDQGDNEDQAHQHGTRSRERRPLDARTQTHPITRPRARRRPRGPASA